MPQNAIPRFGILPTAPYIREDRRRPFFKTVTNVHAPETNAVAAPPLTSSFESFDGIAEALRQPPPVDQSIAGDGPQNGHLLPQSLQVQPPTDAISYRPLLRQPMALVHIVDDAREEGEIVRMRGDALGIGRLKGDIQIPHDILMSSPHCLITRIPHGGWELSDQESKDGTFVRVNHARLKNDSQFQIGATRFRFEFNEYGDDTTEAWLVELLPQRNGQRYQCHAPDTFIGNSDGGCSIAIKDHFISLEHARIKRTPHGWRIYNSGINGLWIRIESPVKMTGPSQFQCGEQRFIFVPLVS